jgi:hypothetical protein
MLPLSNPKTDDNNKSDAQIIIVALQHKRNKSERHMPLLIAKGELAAEALYYDYFKNKDGKFETSNTASSKLFAPFRLCQRFNSNGQEFYGLKDSFRNLYFR